MLSKLIKCESCGKNYSRLFRHDADGWYDVCPHCNEVHRLNLPDLDGHVTMMFVHQPLNDSYRYFIDLLNVKDMAEVPFVSVQVFDTPKQFLTAWYKMAYEYPGYDIPSMWYFVFNGTDQIISGAVDPCDDEIFAEHFGEAIRGWRRPKEPTLKDECIRLLKKKVTQEQLREIHGILNPVIHGQDRVCPVCGAEVEYNGDQEIIDELTKVTWACSACGCSGEQWSRIVFDGHSNVVRDDTGEYVIY